MKKFTVQHLATAAAVGAVYAVLSIFGSVFGVTFGTVQCRFAEALCVLPFFFPETVWGLFVGCLITNLLRPLSWRPFSPPGAKTGGWRRCLRWCAMGSWWAGCWPGSRWALPAPSA